MDPQEAFRLRREDILAVCQAHGASNVAVFGSVARGQGHAGSDLDLLVDLDPSRNLLDRIAIKQDLEDLLGCPVDVVTRRTIHPLLRDEVFGQAVAL